MPNIITGGGTLASGLGIAGKNVIFQDSFTHREGLLTNWTDASAAFINDIRPGVVKVLSAGELVYSGTPLNQFLGTEDFSDPYADWAISLVLRGTDNLKFTIRIRRQDEDNSIGFSVDFENGIARLIKRTGGSDSILVQTSHVFVSEGFRKYVMGIWVEGVNVHGFVNQYNLVSIQESAFRTENGFSIYVPEIDVLAPPKLYGVIVYRTDPQVDPQISDPSNLLVQSRLRIKEEIENPAARTWETYKKAHNLWRTFKDQGHTDEQWAALGYPIKRPSTEEWFG